MSFRVGINGFGRIGRSVFRIFHERKSAQVVCINDLYDNRHLAYLLQFDSVMGRFPGSVSADDRFLYVEGQPVAMTAERDPAAIPWAEWGVDCVIEATGVFRSRDKLERHLQAGAKKVVLTVPPKDDLDLMVVIGVNDSLLLPEHRLISNASCTTNCLAPIARILHESFSIQEGIVSTVHAYTNDQRLADVPHKDLRRSRAAAANIIPTSTGAARAVGKVLPALAGKLDGVALRVPVPDGSVIDFAARLGALPTVEEINRSVEAAAATTLRGIVEYSTAPLVSTDIIGNPHSSVFDALSTQALGDGWVRVIAWYDNEWGYSHRVVDLVGQLATFART